MVQNDDRIFCFFSVIFIKIDLVSLWKVNLVGNFYMLIDWDGELLDLMSNFLILYISKVYYVWEDCMVY